MSFFPKTLLGKKQIELFKRFIYKQKLIRSTLILGDGVSPELCACVIKIFRELRVPIKFDIFRLSDLDPHNSDTLEEVVDSVMQNTICLKGVLGIPALGSPIKKKYDINIQFRKVLDLYVNVTHIKSFPGVITKQNGIDFYVFREQTEGEYSTLEHESVGGVVEHLKIITRSTSKKLARFACEYALRKNKTKITVVHKANIMKKTDGLFLESCKAVANRYPELTIQPIIVDHCVMELVRNPQQFEVLLCPSLYGNIIVNISSGLVGGYGFVCAANYSSEIAMFEPASRYAYVKATGKNIANPTAMILAGAKLLNTVGLYNESELIKRSVYEVFLAGKCRTKDMGGNCTTDEFTDAVIKVATTNCT